MRAFLLVEGEKMSKSAGNFYALRDLVLKGHKPSVPATSARLPVPYRNQLNFTFDGLILRAVSVERLRNFRLRLNAGSFEAGSNPQMAVASETIAKMRAALEGMLNTAQAQAAIFEMVRQANTALDSGALKKDDATALLGALKKFDEVFAVLEDDDAPKMKKVLQWARKAGNATSRILCVRHCDQANNSDIESKINEMKAARTARDFKKSDAIRAELTEAGVLIEITKDGVRWRRM